MPLFNWKPEYSVNNKIIDEQHIKLIDTINIFHDAMKSGKGNDVLENVFNNLSEYVNIHFSTEEKLMKDYDFPYYKEHGLEHEKCRKKIAEFKNQYEKGEIALSVELAIFLFDWVHEHLLNMDKKYSRFLNDKGVY
jgi:hemerythrin-like metal-binding protein